MDYIRQVFPLSADEYLRNFADSLDTLKKLHPESRNLLIQVIQSVENGKPVDNRKRLAIHGLLGIIHYLKRHHPIADPLMNEWIRAVESLLHSNTVFSSDKIIDTVDNLEMLGLMGLSGNQFPTTLPIILGLASSPVPKRTLLNRIYDAPEATLPAGIVRILTEHMTSLKK